MGGQRRKAVRQASVRGDGEIHEGREGKEDQERGGGRVRRIDGVLQGSHAGAAKGVFRHGEAGDGSDRRGPEGET